MKRPQKIGLVERAVITKNLREMLATSRIHALMGGDSNQLVHQAGMVMYVVLGAAIAEDLPADTPYLKIIRGAVNALSDQAEVEEISAVHRASICSGLEACMSLLEYLPYKAVVDAACDLELQRRVTRFIGTQDFNALIAKLNPKSA